MVYIVCYTCNKHGHLARNCTNKNLLIAYVNLIKLDLVTMITKIDVIGGFEGCWLDTGASRHIFHDFSLFKKYNKNKN